MFDDNTLYLSTDPKLDVIASYGTRARWRMKGSGPAFVKLGPRRVAYLGRTLNEWIDAHTVKPRGHAAA